MDLSKMAIFFPEVAAFNLKMDKVSVKATIVENENQLVSGIEELRKAITNSPLVGFDLKTRTVSPVGYWRYNTVRRHILFLYVENRCLVIPIDPSDNISEFLQPLLSDTSVCFVGKNVSEKVRKLEACSLKAMATPVDVILLAARVFKNPELRSCNCLVHVGKSIGLDFMELKKVDEDSGKDPDWTYLCLSEKDMMIEMREGYMCYKIADFCRKRRAHDK